MGWSQERKIHAKWFLGNSGYILVASKLVKYVIKGGAIIEMLFLVYKSYDKYQLTERKTYGMKDRFFIARYIKLYDMKVLCGRQGLGWEK